MNKIKFISASLALLVALSGCATNQGPKLIQNQRFIYNEKFKETETEQMLMNLVRLRYHETPVFFELSSIVTQYTVRNYVNAQVVASADWVPGSKTPFGIDPKADGNRTFEERPTVTYSPLQGEAFANKILSPIAPEKIFLLSEAGWSISRLMRICIQRINGVENAVAAAGPTPSLKPDFEDFFLLVHSLRSLQKKGFVNFEATQSQEGIITYRFLIDPIPEDEPELKKMAKDITRLLGSLETPESAEITLYTRSLLSMLFYLSQGVNPPAEHFEEGLVTATVDANDNAFDWQSLLQGLLVIRSQKKEPDDAFIKVKHRGYWFYVSNTDLTSKDTLSLLSYLLSLQSVEGKGNLPLLTIS